ncbi:30S ribosomal protein S9 [Candidatus Micrarchaeota archaeon]|nr:30S ribosomal protein S9 [Candidatus Micrarchaeota archaeon]
MEKTKKKPTKRKVKSKVSIARGKRKESIARVSIKKGKGIIRINNTNLEVYGSRQQRQIIKEPLLFAPKISTEVDIIVSVNGGGSIGQAQAIRNAIAIGLIEYSDDKGLKEIFMDRDRFMVVEDSRRTEPKKFGGRGARARKQKSYR